MTKNEKIMENLIDHFDFKSARRVMKALEWDFEYGKIPTLNEMQETCRHLIFELLKDKKADYTSTGGFTAFRINRCIGLKMDILETYEEEN
jgi:hypothetical protein